MRLPPRTGRLLLALLIVAALAGFFLFGLGDWLALDTLKARRADLAGLLAARPTLVIGAFFLAYVLLVAFSVPGAIVMTLAAGAVFDLWLGVLIVSFASTIGASLAFVASRYLFRSWVERRYGARLAALDRGFARDGFVYLLALRLNPAVPFFLVNLGMGLTRMNLIKFALVSQIGMLPATFVYVAAGTELARIRTLGDVASPWLIGSLLLLSLFPLIGKAAAGWLRRRRVYRGWRRPRRFDRNLIVIGAGAGGLVTAFVGAAVRARVTLIEARAMGGDCLNSGCVPSKTLIRSARAAREIAQSERFGIAAQPVEVDFPAVMRRVREVIATIAPADSVERYRGLGVDVRIGHATIVDPWTVEVNAERITARAIVIAAGAEPVVPQIPGLQAGDYLTSETMWDALEARGSLPARLTILGGGGIGVEMAQAFARLGSRVTLVEAADHILAKEDGDASAVIHAVLAEEGVDIRAGTAATRSEPGALIVTKEGAETRIEHDALLIAIGRRPRLKGYGLEALGIDPESGLEANAWLETRFPNIYAVGDVEGRWQFTHAASHQAWHAAVNALFGSFRRFKVDMRLLPRVTFADPELAQIGEDEASARASGTAFETVRYDLSHLDRAVAEGATKGFVKLIVAEGKDRILGATIVAHNAGELIAVIALAMKKRIGLKTLLATIHAYPTMAEANRMAAGQWRRAHQPERLLKWVEAWHRWRRG